MPEDRSLEEFAGAELDADADTNADAEADTDAGADAEAVDTVDLAEPTYDYSPDGAACAACGESVTRRWRDDGDYVCGDCKEW
ncbi:DUF7573 domain-containing protein [Halobaculum magnesiiphilum]|uniref:DUF7573 domain-containing protein n=1 Tax=Halobaculum magnesiiphilum TaxID=1017351 RepID=A0A8T8W914_9EURY|nr:hypothetical protein [Halobaculum magnesiiphilum]QZP36274.1 hypothetical protein K6T50_07930 [Halobaculum magnesiiphilum]